MKSLSRITRKPSQRVQKSTDGSITGSRIQSPEVGPRATGSLEHSRHHLNVHGHSEQHGHRHTAKQLEITIENPAIGSMNSQIIVQ